jgi:hypothetical protein
MQFHRQPVSGDAHRLQELLPKNFRCTAQPAGPSFLMLTNYFLPAPFHLTLIGGFRSR